MNRLMTFTSALALAAMTAIAAADPSTAPSGTTPSGTTPSATAAPTTQQGRPLPEIVSDLKAASGDLDKAMNFRQLPDADARQAAAPKVMPCLKRLKAIGDELSASPDPRAKLYGKQVQVQLRSMLMLFDDPAATADASKDLASSDPQISRHAMLDVLFVNWIRADKDAVAQGKLLDTAEADIKAHPDSVESTVMLVTMSNMGPANDQLKKRVLDDATSMDNQAAVMLKKQLQRAATQPKAP